MRRQTWVVCTVHGHRSKPPPQVRQVVQSDLAVVVADAALMTTQLSASRSWPGNGFALALPPAGWPMDNDVAVAAKASEKPADRGLAAIGMLAARVPRLCGPFEAAPAPGARAESGARLVRCRGARRDAAYRRLERPSALRPGRAIYRPRRGFGATPADGGLATTKSRTRPPPRRAWLMRSRRRTEAPRLKTRHCLARQMGRRKR
jgi:hypothetical protein